jgi:hypothetical protein
VFPLFAWVVATLTIEHQNYEILSAHLSRKPMWGEFRIWLSVGTSLRPVG